jgi:hypothetical protein
MYNQQHHRLYTLDFVRSYFKGISANIELQVYNAPRAMDRLDGWPKWAVSI